MFKRGMLALIFALVVAGTAWPVDASGPSQPAQRGLFGTVTAISGDHPRAVAGETDITLETSEGPQEVTAVPHTTFRVPGVEQATLEDISVGDQVAILAGDGRAIAILVKTLRPVRVRHFTGIVTAEGNGEVSIRDAAGRQISAPALMDFTELETGDMVTAVLEQDLATGALLITGLDRALDNLKRLQSALQQAQSTKSAANLAALQRRLSENSTRHLTTLQDLAQKANPSLRDRLQSRMESARSAYSEGMSRFDAGRPTARVRGIVTVIDEERRRLSVQPAGLEQVELVVTPRTSIRFGGKDIQFNQLDLANRVEARYDLESHELVLLKIFPGEILDTGVARILLETKDPGEISGTVTGIDFAAMGPPLVIVRDSVSNETVNLRIANDSVILNGGSPAELARNLLDSQVTALFDPQSLELIELDTTGADPEDMTISGVAHRFVSKTVPGNFSILTRDGAVKTFNRTDETVIRRDGRRVSINEVRLGDLVRPNSRYSASKDPTPDLVFLSLKSPPPAPVHGTIRGIAELAQAETRVTISNSQLDIVSLLVDGNTRLTRQGKTIDTITLSVGQRVLNGTYDPISHRAIRLTLQPFRSAQVRGEITGVDKYRLAISIKTPNGDTVRLLIPESKASAIPGRGKKTLDFGAIQVGGRVRVALYDPATNQLLRLMLG